MHEMFWQVMLLGHNDNNAEDKAIKVTIAFNYFGSGLVQRMPRYYYTLVILHTCILDSALSIVTQLTVKYACN